MKLAKFFLGLLVVIAVVLGIALLLVWGLNLGVMRSGAPDGETRVYTEQEQAEILKALDAQPQREYTAEEQRQILESLETSK